MKHILINWLLHQFMQLLLYASEVAVKRTDNTIDDQFVAVLKENLIQLEKLIRSLGRK